MVCNQRIHPSAVVIVSDGLFVGRPLDVKAPPGDLAVSRLGSWAAPPRLPVLVFFAHGTTDLQIAADVVLLENHLYLQVNLGSATQPLLRPRHARAQLLELS